MQDQMEEDNKKHLVIPRIIHKLAPDRKDWHPVWVPCYYSWKKTFYGKDPQFRFDMWHDVRIDSYIENYWTDYWEVWHNFPIQIVKLDIARYILMYEFGGIYSDMDTYCYKYFYDELKGDTIYIGPSQVEEHELVQNSFLASHGRSLFWREVIEEAFKRIKEFDRGIGTIATGINSEVYRFIQWSAGCGLLSDVYSKMKDEYKIEILDKTKYQVEPEKYNENVITRHMSTGRWGHKIPKIVVENYRKKHPDMSVEEILKLDYKDFRGIDIDTLDWNKPNG